MLDLIGLGSGFKSFPPALSALLNCFENPSILFEGKAGGGEKAQRTLGT